MPDSKTRQRKKAARRTGQEYVPTNHYIGFQRRRHQQQEDELWARVRRLESENADLKDERKDLRRDVQDLEDDARKLKKENKELRADTDVDDGARELKAEVEKLTKKLSDRKFKYEAFEVS